MATYLTPRLGLLVDPLNETDINVQHGNWDIVDANAGYNTVDAVITLPVGYTYDGALFAERKTGISGFVLAGNSIRTVLPYVYSAYYTSPGIAHNTVRELGWDIFNAGASVNASIADRAAGNSWKAPYDGLYSIEIVARWDAQAVGDRRLYYSKNAVLSNNFESFMKAMGLGGTTTNRMHVNLKLAAGDVIRPVVIQTSGITVGMTTTIQVVLTGAL